MSDNLKSISPVITTNKKIKTPMAQIIARKMTIEPYNKEIYYEIAYYNTEKHEICTGYGSFKFDFVFEWLNKEFEIESENIEIVPIQHGKWEDGNHICPICGQSKFKNLDADIWADWQPLYCPNCGSKMQ